MGIRADIRFKLILYSITAILTVIAIIGFMCCEHKYETTIEISGDTIKNTTKENDMITETNVEQNDTTIDIETDEDGDTNQAIMPVSLGRFKLTAYCPCEKCCGKWANNRPNGIVYGAIGEELKEGYSIAVDPNVIPYGTEVIINGRTYKAQDCGGAIKENRIDVYFESHQDALNFGVQYAEVFVKM